MSLGLLLPGALAALVALIVPLIIHIARRSEQNPTDFAALRWLRQKPRPRSRLRFDEWPLLVLRLLLLALAILWLAHPVLFGAADERPYIAVVPGADIDRAVIKGKRLHWLAPGFPDIDETPTTTRLPVASLIRQLDAELPPATPLTIITPTIIEGADAERPRPSRKVIWRIVPGAMPAPQPSAAPPPVLAIRHDDAHRPALRYLRAVMAAWQPAARSVELDAAMLDAPLPDTRHVLVWLASGTLPDNVGDWVEQGGTLLAASDLRLPSAPRTAPVWRDTQGAPLAVAMPMGKGRLLRFTRPLTPAQMPVLLEPAFPTQLRAILQPVPAPARVAAVDYAPLTGGRRYTQPPRSLQPWLAMLIALLLIAERWVATRRRRSIAP